MKLTKLLEVTFSEATQVDREAGVIRNVKVLGRSSRNGRVYSEAALRQAARLYEGLGVNLNHPDRRESSIERPVQDGFGWLEGVRLGDDGVYGDLHYLRSHPHSAVIVEAAERNPRRFGLSHNAEGRVARRDGRTIVESIESVRSVDLVQNPATNRGLFESEERRSSRERGAVEDDGHSQETESLPEGAEGPTGCGAATEPPRTLVPPPRPSRGEVEGEEGEERRVEGEAMESEGSNDTGAAREPGLVELIEEVRSLRAEVRCLTLLEAAGREVRPERLQALAALATDNERRELIESWPQREVSAHRPRPATSAPLVASRSGFSVYPAEHREFVKALR
jgi:hypothetical protein